MNQVLGSSPKCPLVHQIFHLPFLIVINHDRVGSIMSSTIRMKVFSRGIGSKFRNMKNVVNLHVIGKIQSIGDVADSLDDLIRTKEFFRKLPRRSFPLIIDSNIFRRKKNEISRVEFQLPSLFVSEV